MEGDQDRLVRLTLIYSNIYSLQTIWNLLYDSLQVYSMIASKITFFGITIPNEFLVYHNGLVH